MSGAGNNRLRELLEVIQQFVGRELTAPEALVLASIFPSLQAEGAPARAPDPISEARQRAALVVAEGRKRADDTIGATLRNMGGGPGRPVVPPVANQVTEHLAELVKTEVARCFDERFGALNQQMVSALQQLSGLVGSSETPDSSGNANPVRASAPKAALLLPPAAQPH